MKRAYFRCNGGDYFFAQCCPFDGWSSPELLEAHAAILRMESEHKDITIETLKHSGVSPLALQRIIVIDFGSSAAVFDALTPGLYIKDGHVQKQSDFGPDLT